MQLPAFIIEQPGEISKEKAGLLSRKLAKFLSNPENFAVVDAIVKQETAEPTTQQRQSNDWSDREETPAGAQREIVRS